MCFIGAPAAPAAILGRGSLADAVRLAEIERELEATKVELSNAVHNMET